MFFKFTVASVLASLAMVQASAAALVTKSNLDVFSPRILSPNAETVWTIGTEQLILWDASNAPAEITSPGEVFLDNQFEGPPLASGFDLRAGNITIVVPNVIPGRHFITLFGDSGNDSPLFNIVAA